ncbi:MAG TPA: hypothetical protein VMD29_06790 [Terracidiphilus sp.]|nr:hypothetical protein [Terracidiphilus sp.]
MGLVRVSASIAAFATFLSFHPLSIGAAPKKAHVVVLGGVRQVPYSKAGDPAGAQEGESTLKIRPLIVDGSVKEWTTGDAHDVTDRSFVVRRALRLNDELPGEKITGPGAEKERWVWQRGPWLLVDRVTGHETALKLPDYDPGVSHVSWFRDYAAYCGVTASGKSLYAVVAQLAARKPVMAKKVGALDPDPKSRPETVCGEPAWQREPLRVTFHPEGREEMSFDVAPGSALLVEDSDDEPEKPE